MMGSGKSVIGPLLAHRLGTAFVDTDAVVVHQAGESIIDLWNRHGEAAFRSLEATAIAEAAVGPAAVVATGGGAVVDDDNVAAMSAAGSIVWLRASLETLTTRLGSGAGRPLLAGDDRFERLSSIYEERYAVYEAAADLTVDTDDSAAADVAERIEAWWNES
jgi:shikimate kinase